MAGTERQEVVYVLGSRHTPGLKREYYTGEKPTFLVSEAKTYDTREKAMNTRKFAHTGWQYHVIKVSRKKIFQMTLEGK